MFNIQKKRILDRYIRQRKRAQIASAGIIICFVLLLLIGFFTYLGANTGTFTIAVSDPLHGYGISISEEPDDNYGVMLAADTVRCIPVAYQDIDFDSIGEKNGNYSSNKFLAYTFYVKNAGDLLTPVHVSLEVLESTKHIDSAIRIAFIRNGEESLYLKDDANIIAEEDMTPYDQAKYFISSKYIFVEDEYTYLPGEVRKYSIVVWVEGWDAQCTDDLIGGAIKLKLVFEVPNDNL